MHFFAQKSASTLEVDALFSSSRPPCSLLAACLQPPCSLLEGLLMHLVVRSTRACLLAMSLRHHCSRILPSLQLPRGILAASLHPSCNLLMHFAVQTTQQPWNSTRFLVPSIILAASQEPPCNRLKESLVQTMQQPFEIDSLFAPMQPPCSLFAASLRHPCSPLMHFAF